MIDASGFADCSPREGNSTKNADHQRRVCSKKHFSWRGTSSPKTNSGPKGFLGCLALCLNPVQKVTNLLPVATHKVVFVFLQITAFTFTLLFSPCVFSFYIVAISLAFFAFILLLKIHSHLEGSLSQWTSYQEDVRQFVAWVENVEENLDPPEKQCPEMRDKTANLSKAKVMQSSRSYCVTVRYPRG